MRAAKTSAALSSTALLAGLSALAASPAASPQPAATRFISIGTGQIAYDDTGGPGPLVIAIPGMGDLRSEYRLLRPLLQQAGYRVVTMDLRGMGESSAQWDDYSAHAVGRDALALISRLNAGPAVILGNSFAAGAALWAAHDDATRVTGVALLGPVLRDAQVSWLARASLQLAFAGPWNVWAWTAYWNSLFPTRKPADQAQARAALARNLHEPHRMAALKAMVELSKADTAAMVASNRVPVLVVMGTRDPDFDDPVAEAQWVVRQTGGQSLIVEGAGHYPHTEMPEKVAPTLLDFLARLRAPGAGAP